MATPALWLPLSLMLATPSQLEMEQRVRALPSDDPLATLRALAEAPSAAVPALVKELRPVAAVRSTPEHPDTRVLHIAWVVRALQCLTGLDFVAAGSLGKPRSEVEQRQANFLTLRHPGHVSFFGYQESHDVVFLAPVWAQRSIIRQWVNWSHTRPRDFEFKKTCGRGLDWRWYANAPVGPGVEDADSPDEEQHDAQ